ncbi:hypothetical protein ASC97_04390 [Rhizobium sp. Root1203]|uniref:hypothetical protein n=1 Tax=Rhizobium sp. Root1203 TaxID=1736427 RepID=UPI00070DBE13|nr:hypothetical protein [Rhizobium sp. Root1203]KQV27621.1 hypothetical protein ASC97_04390 [Rhizobium sp. Root1203]
MQCDAQRAGSDHGAAQPFRINRRSMVTAMVALAGAASLRPTDAEVAPYDKAIFYLEREFRIASDRVLGRGHKDEADAYLRMVGIARAIALIPAGSDALGVKEAVSSWSLRGEGEAMLLPFEVVQDLRRSICRDRLI